MKSQRFFSVKTKASVYEEKPLRFFCYEFILSLMKPVFISLLIVLSTFQTSAQQTVNNKNETIPSEKINFETTLIELTTYNGKGIKKSISFSKDSVYLGLMDMHCDPP